MIYCRAKTAVVVILFLFKLTIVLRRYTFGNARLVDLEIIHKFLRNLFI